MSGQQIKRNILLLAAIMLAVGAWFRVKGLFTDFWLDEIWALSFAAKVTSPLDIFTSIHFDTNHWLYTFFLWALGDRPGWILYRIPSLIAGILLVLLMFEASLDKSGLGRLITLGLSAFSFPLIFYSSEARGYALLMLFSVLAFYLIGRVLSRPEKYMFPLFWLVSVLGFLSHLTYVFLWVALLVWSAGSLWKQGRWKKTIAGILRLHAVPGILFLALYFVDIRKIQHGGGEVETLPAILARLSGWMTGVPSAGALGIAAVLLAVAIVGIELFRLWPERQQVGLFFLALFAANFGIPIITGLISGFSYWSPRHFIVCVPFFLLLFGRFLSNGLRFWSNRMPMHGTGSIVHATNQPVRGHMGWTIVLSLLMVVYLGGNLFRTVDFWRRGRGHYQEAVQYLAAESNGTISIGSDNDFRNKFVLFYYARYLPKTVTLNYYDHDAWPPGGPDWVLQYRMENEKPPQPAIRAKSGIPFKLVRTFVSSGTSGWNWDLYRNTRADLKPAN